jgi:hypothetical protein
VAVVGEGVQGRVDGHRQRPHGGHGLHHLLLIAGGQVDEPGPRAADLVLLEAASPVLGLVRVRLLRVDATIRLERF